MVVYTLPKTPAKVTYTVNLQNKTVRLGTNEPVFDPKSDRRELALIPSEIFESPVHFQSSIAQVAPHAGVGKDTWTVQGGCQLRFREFVIFKNTLIYPEFLLEYSRLKQ